MTPTSPVTEIHIVGQMIPMSHLVQILLPLADQNQMLFAQAFYDKVRDELTAVFGGVTMYSNSPAEGLWDAGDRIHSDQMLTVEVMVGHLDREWWSSYRVDLEPRFSQHEIVIRALLVERL